MRGAIEISGADVILKVASVPEDIQNLVGKDCDIDIKEHKEKRSLDANAYFHKLCDLLRQKLGISMAECKNDLICSYGQIEYIDEIPVVIDTNIPPEVMRKNEFLHASCVEVGTTGTYSYVVYRGSHTYDTKEMAALIKGTIEEAKAQGIETATPYELEALWQKIHTR